MDTLFEGMDEIKKVDSFKIVSTGKKPLSNKQQFFNKLTKRIEKLETDINNENEKLYKLSVYYSTHLRPIITENANLRLKLAMFLDRATENIKFGINQLDKIGEVIVFLCNESFKVIIPDPEQEDLYDQWSSDSYKNELEDQREASKEVVSDLMKDMLGMEIDMSDFDDTPEGFINFQRKVKEEFKKTQQDDNNNKKKKKSKKQIQNEERIKSEELIKNKSIRSVYIALAKILHPDTETDLVLKAEKEEIMKKVTSAYENKNLLALLKLEMEWIYKENEHLEQLAEDKLNIYISILKQQIFELEKEKKYLYMNPKYYEISDVGSYSEQAAMKYLKSEVNEQKSIKKDFTELLKEFEKPMPKKRIIKFVNEFLDASETNELFNIWDEFR